MKLSTSLLILAGCVTAAALAGGGSPPVTRAAYANFEPAIRFPNGQRVTLQKAGIVIWSGAGLPGGVMTVYCTTPAVNVGHINNAWFALNGNTASFGDRSTFYGTNGETRTIYRSEAQTLTAHGLLEQGGDPYPANMRISEGNNIGLKHCGK